MHAAGLPSVAPGLAYPVLVDEGLLDRTAELVFRYAPAHAYVVISDRNVAELYAKRVLSSFGSSGARLLEMPAGETHKTVATWSQLIEEMLLGKLGRDTTVIALGGGVVGDVAGFVAAAFMRGVPVVQVPTTVVAMVDASIGGKTGVNARAGKNLIGAFHQPSAVLCDPTVLATLPPRELRAGLAEVIKHGIIADDHYLAQVEESLPEITETRGGGGSMRGIIARSIEIKAGVVARDEREGGLRKILNFGHTIGHAVESLSNYSLLHGEAVAIGMTLEAEIAERAGVAVPGTAARIRQSLKRAGLESSRPTELEPEAIVQRAATDKKARGGQLEFALPAHIGTMAGADSGWSVRVERQIVLEALE